MSPPTPTLPREREPPQARAIPPAQPASPLTEAHFALLREMAAARQPVRKAARKARVSAITTLAIGALGLPLTLFFPGWLSFAMAVGICTIGAIEYVGARRLRAGQPTAAGFLGRNQLAFLGLIVAYCLIQMLTFSNADTLVSPELRSQLAQLPGLEQDITHWAPIVTYGFYSIVIVLSIAAQGGLALYYFTRRPYLETLQRTTPPWVQRLFTELGV